MKLLKGSIHSPTRKWQHPVNENISQFYITAFLTLLMFTALITPIETQAATTLSANIMTQNSKLIEQCGPAGKVTVKVLGFVKLPSGIASKDLIVTAFNGFKIFNSRLNENGAYCVGVEESTQNTFIMLTISGPNLVPQVKNTPLKFEPTDAGATVIAGPNFDPVPSDKPTQGYLVASAYMDITGGRPVNHFGIEKFVPGLQLKINGEDGQSIKTNKQGNVVMALDPGKYQILTEKNVQVDVEIKSGETTITPLYSGGSTIF